MTLLSRQHLEESTQVVSINPSVNPQIRHDNIHTFFRKGALAPNIRQIVQHSLQTSSLNTWLTTGQKDPARNRLSLLRNTNTNHRFTKLYDSSKRAMARLSTRCSRREAREAGECSSGPAAFLRAAASWFALLRVVGGYRRYYCLFWIDPEGTRTNRIKNYLCLERNICSGVWVEIAISDWSFLAAQERSCLTLIEHS